MTATGIFILLYGILVLLGGIVGFIKAHSVVSLVSGLFFGIVLAISGWLMIQGNKRGLYWAFAFSLVLTVLFLYRYLQTYKMMPAGMMGVLSAVVCILLVLQKMRMMLDNG